MSSFSLHPWFEDPSRRLRILLGEEKNPCEQHFNLIRDYFAIETWAMMVDPILNAAERFHSKLRAYYIAQRLPDNVSSTDLRTLRDTSTYEFYIVGKQERFALLYCAEQKTIEDVQSYRREFNEVIEHTFCAPHN
jgi:hypothetical protein